MTEPVSGHQCVFSPAPLTYWCFGNPKRSNLDFQLLVFVAFFKIFMEKLAFLQWAYINHLIEINIWRIKKHLTRLLFCFVYFLVGFYSHRQKSYKKKNVEEFFGCKLRSAASECITWHADQWPFSAIVHSVMYMYMYM